MKRASCKNWSKAKGSQKLAENRPVYDLAVIGGGINGVAIARDAAGRGAKVILFEKGDLARGTSSASTKLIHGGLRYLEHYEFSLVRESLIEREILWSIAPHVIHPLRFVIPYEKGLRPKWMLRLGLFIYDHLGGRKKLPVSKSIDLTHDVAGAPLKAGFTSGFEYSDGWVDDARMVVLTAMDAHERGAKIITHCEVQGMKRGSGFWSIDTQHGQYNAKVAVNAAGPAVLDLLAHVAGHERDPGEELRLVRGSHIIVKKLFDHPKAYFCQNTDGRIFFAIPYEDDFTLIGTTDADHHGSLDHIEASDEEIAYISASASHYFKQQITPKDVIWSYAGVRPLVADSSGKPETASRGYHFDIDAGDNGQSAPLLSVFGGKITTHRHLAESVMAKLAHALPMLGGPGWTANAPLPGGEFAVEDVAKVKTALASHYPFLETAVVNRFVRSYGLRSKNWLGDAKSLADLGIQFGHGLSSREVDYLVNAEWARSTEDILWRRSKLGLRFSKAQVTELQKYLSGKFGGL
jgi:glycerol-3-phosphate dehydrogenase